MRLYRLCCLLAAVLGSLAISCGRDRSVLAKVGNHEIRTGEYREAFASLSPQEQVEVLRPGGRTALLERLVTKNLLELACDSGNTRASSAAWVDLYETSWLAREWSEIEYQGYRSAQTDTTSLLALTQGFRLAIALLPDSDSAVSTLSGWTANGPSAPSRTALAPWTAGGSSFRVLNGIMLNLSPDLEAAISAHAGSDDPFAFPIYGAWAVAAIDTIGPLSDTLPAGIGTFSFLRDVERRAGVGPSSRGIESLSSLMVMGDNGYYFPDLSGIDPGTVLAVWDGGIVTAGEVAGLFEAIQPDSFFGGAVPEELSVFAPPQAGPAGPAIDLWFYVTALAQTRWEAEQGRAAGLNPDSAHAGMMATVENLLRREVLERAGTPDSSAMLDYYSRNRGSLVYPERRSVVLAYVPSELADSIGLPPDFGPLSQWTPLDSGGRPIPTPLQPPESFGPMAEAVFSAEQGIVTGPVETGTPGMAAYFQVLSIAPPDTAEAFEVWPLLESGARAEKVEAAFGAYISELRSRFGVEIDSTAVEAIDPWGSSY
jgi:hypothetical protein